MKCKVDWKILLEEAFVSLGQVHIGCSSQVHFATKTPSKRCRVLYLKDYELYIRYFMRKQTMIIISL